MRETQIREALKALHDMKGLLFPLLLRGRLEPEASFVPEPALEHMDRALTEVGLAMLHVSASYREKLQLLGEVAWAEDRCTCPQARGLEGVLQVVFDQG